jgi:hypothetical protein
MKPLAWPMSLGPVPVLITGANERSNQGRAVR